MPEIGLVTFQFDLERVWQSELGIDAYPKEHDMKRTLGQMNFGATIEESGTRQRRGNLLVVVDISRIRLRCHEFADTAADRTLHLCQVEFSIDKFALPLQAMIFAVSRCKACM